MFSVEYRERVRAYLLQRAESDERVVAGAVVGAEAGGRIDRWSDLDLSFGVAPGIPIGDVLADWTRELSKEFQAVRLFDLKARSSVYRVFLLPANLQLDLSFTPAGEFGPTGPEFRLLFGNAAPIKEDPPLSADDVFGLGVHHLVRGRFCVERGKYWQAEYWISEARDKLFALACLRRGLNPWHGRGIDRLPSDLLGELEPSLVASVDRVHLLASLRLISRVLLREAGDSAQAAKALQEHLRDLETVA